MKQFILGLSIGLSLWGFVACGVPDHWHPTTDIKQVDNNNAGVCQCEKPTNTLKLVVVDTKCENPVVINQSVPSRKGIELKDVKPEDIVSVFATSGGGTAIGAELPRKGDNGKWYLSCGTPRIFKILIR